MLTKEKNIRDLLKQGKKIYEIEDAQVFRTKKPSKTEPGQALSVRAHVALAQAGIGSMGITDDMFDFDANVTVDEAIEKSAATLLPAGVSSLYDLVNQRVALLRREFNKYASENINDSSMREYTPPIESEDESSDAV